MSFNTLERDLDAALEVVESIKRLEIEEEEFKQRLPIVKQMKDDKFTGNDY